MARNVAKEEIQEENSRTTQIEAIEVEVDRQIGSLVNQKQRELIVQRVANIVVSETFSGPIAHPRHLREYEEILPGSAERIVTMAEQRSDHISEMDKRFLKAEFTYRMVGQVIGGGLFAFLIAAALYVSVISKDWQLAGVFLGTAAIGGISVFIRGRKSKD